MAGKVVGRQLMELEMENKLLSGAHNEKEFRLRKKERETPTGLIEISKRTHASRVTKDIRNRSDSMAEKVVAAGMVGFVTVRSSTPTIARGTFVPPVAETVTLRRSPHLLGKRTPYTTTLHGL